MGRSETSHGALPYWCGALLHNLESLEREPMGRRKRESTQGRDEREVERGEMMSDEGFIPTHLHCPLSHPPVMEAQPFLRL
jgi:hypothetical protein